MSESVISHIMRLENISKKHHNTGFDCLQRTKLTIPFQLDP